MAGRTKEIRCDYRSDSLIIKKTHSLLDFSSEPEEDFMPLEEINEEVHKARKENEDSR